MENKIGNIKLDSRLILAPMAGVNTAAFRLLCRENGAGLVSTPMIHVRQVTSLESNIIERTAFLKDEKPISVQLVGADTDYAKQATLLLDEYADIFDINFGCPDKDVLGNKEGGFFSKHPEQMKKMISPVISNTNKPVTAKIRIGWDEKTVNVLESVKILQELGVDAIAIHGRTVKQGYSGKANWDLIKQAKEIVDIPIIGNGDVFKPGNAKAMIDQTKCDFAMIGRGSMGNPMLFKRCNHLLETGENLPETSKEERIENAKKFLDYYEKYENNRSFTESRQQVMWFMKEFDGASEYRKKLMNAKTFPELKDIIL
ncbi:tRNA dihydrouridine synthase DusB [Candidatus Woesearchaeota archaeon]|nr:MAG: tRNA dihydrouridine synthase DusB [Candidatus Woesearchaeota archaeon]